MEKFFLKKYTVSQEYEDIYNYNFSVINRLTENSYFNDIINFMSQISNLDREVLVLDLQRYLMINNEYKRYSIEKKSFKYLYLILFLLKLFYKSFKPDFLSKDNNYIMIDKWYDNSLNNFYGEKFIKDISTDHKVTFFTVKHTYIKFTFLLKHVKDIFKTMVEIKKLEEILNISLLHYVYSFFAQFLTGKSLRLKISPKLIISGDDNGFPVILGKALGASLLFIQNGVRPFCSDSTYKYADHYVMIGTNREIIARKNMGCVFKNVYPYGSVRLASYLAQEKKITDIKYDILFIGTSIITFNKNNEYYAYFSVESECDLLKFLNEYALKSNKKIAYHCRFRQELDTIKKLGLMSDKISYIVGEEESVYKTIDKSHLILSLISTVCVEAMALNKKVGFVNFSGNNCYNQVFKDLNIEYTHESKETFDEFIDRLLKTNINYYDYVVQEKNYMNKIKDVVNKILI
jgi:hypothetical protein